MKTEVYSHIFDCVKEYINDGFPATDDRYDTWYHPTYKGYITLPQSLYTQVMTFFTVNTFPDYVDIRDITVWAEFMALRNDDPVLELNIDIELKHNKFQLWFDDNSTYGFNCYLNKDLKHVVSREDVHILERIDEDLIE